MDDNQFAIIALATAIVGVIALYIISGSVQVSETTINKINSGNLKGDLAVEGIISDVKATGKATFLTIRQEEEASVIVFDNISLKKGQKVRITGSMGDSGIIADRIELT